MNTLNINVMVNYLVNSKIKAFPDYTVNTV